MSILQVQDAAGRGIPRINIRIATDHQSSDQAIFDVFTDDGGGTGCPGVPVEGLEAPPPVSFRFSISAIVIAGPSDAKLAFAVWNPLESGRPWIFSDSASLVM